MDDHMPEQYGLQRKRRRRRHRKRRQRPYWDVNESADPDYSYTQPPAPTHTHHDYEPIICFRLCGKPGHIAIGCRVRLDHSRQAYNFQQINAEDRTYAYQQQSTRETTGLLGSPNEVTMKVNGIAASALLDTGSTVSTVSESFYLQYLANQPIQTLNHILHIECADGEEMPYLGYISRLRAPMNFNIR
jgi:hypothetical protein